jgi:HPt (histidine-containing phosphotransfer) domain-containing protein
MGDLIAGQWYSSVIVCTFESFLHAALHVRLPLASYAELDRGFLMKTMVREIKSKISAVRNSFTYPQLLHGEITAPVVNHRQHHGLCWQSLLYGLGTLAFWRGPFHPSVWVRRQVRPALRLTAGSEIVAAPGQADPIDAAAWDELQHIIGKETDSVVRELIDAYLCDAEPLVSSIVMANHYKDAKAMIKAAHALRSPSASLGALRLASLGGQVEEGLRFEPQQWPQNLVDQMLSEAALVGNALRERRPVGC